MKLIAWYPFWKQLSQVNTSHPYYQQIYQLEATTPSWYTFSIEAIALLTFIPIIFFSNTVYDTVWLLIFVPIILFPSTIYGAIWSVSISRTVASHNRSGMGTLLSVSPIGKFGYLLITAQACLDCRHSFSWVATTIKGRILILGVFIIPFFRIPSNTMADLWLILLAHVLLVPIILYIDHIQAILLSVLISILMPTLNYERADTQWLAFITYLSIQSMIYASTFFISFSIFPIVWRQTAFSETWYSIVQIMLILLGLTIPRNFILSWLMRFWLNNMNVTQHEIEEVLTQAV